MSEFIWVSRAEFEEIKSVIFGIKSNVLDIKYSGCGISIDDPRSFDGGGSIFTPFQVVKKDDTTVTVLGATTNICPNLIIIANNGSVAFAEADKTGITTTGWLYMELTYSSSYSFALGYASVIPTADNTHCYKDIAYIVCVDSKISAIYQTQWGNMTFPGKVF